MYSICIRQHYQKPHKESYGILIFIKQDGIDESGKLIDMYATHKEAREQFEYRVRTIKYSTKRVKDNE